MSEHQAWDSLPFLWTILWASQTACSQTSPPSSNAPPPQAVGGSWRGLIQSSGRAAWAVLETESDSSEREEHRGVALGRLGRRGSEIPQVSDANTRSLVFEGPHLSGETDGQSNPADLVTYQRSSVRQLRPWEQSWKDETSGLLPATVKHAGKSCVCTTPRPPAADRDQWGTAKWQMHKSLSLDIKLIHLQTSFVLSQQSLWSKS